MRHLLLLVATFVFLVIFGIGWNRAAWVGFSCGGALGLAFWWSELTWEPFNPQDRRFYLVVYTGLGASGGMLAGLVWSIIRGTRAGGSKPRLCEEASKARKTDTKP